MSDSPDQSMTDQIIAVFNNPKQWLDQYYVSKVPEIHGSVQIEHFLEYLEGHERILFFNWLSETLDPGNQVHIIVPYYSHPQAFADFAIKWPGFSEHSWLFLDADWRDKHPYTKQLDYKSDFVLWTYEYEMLDSWQTRHDSARTFGIEHYLGVVTRLFVTLMKRPLLDA